MEVSRNLARIVTVSVERGTRGLCMTSWIKGAIASSFRAAELTAPGVAPPSLARQFWPDLLVSPV